jgi:large conductance mechanosensitive channel
MSFLQEFKAFAMRGNVVDMAVGIIIGGAFGKIVSSLVSDVIMPPIGKLMGGVNFSDKFINLDSSKGPFVSLAQAKEAGAAVIAYGQFINVIIDFLIVALAIFMMIKLMNTLKKKEEAKPAPAPVIQAEEKLLTEIRDILKTK